MFFKKKKIGEVELKCPRCNVAMNKVENRGIVIDICPECNGMWLDDKEIDNLLSLGKKKEKKAKKKTKKKSSKKGGKRGKKSKKK